MRRRALLLLPAAGLSAALACKSIEPYVPELIAITGTIIEVAALTYNDGEYAPQVTLLMATLTPAATAMASNYIEGREEARKKEELEKLDAEIQTEYASLEAPFTPAPAQGGGGLSWAAPAESSSSGGLSWGAPATTTAASAPAPATAGVSPAPATAGVLPAPATAGPSPAQAPGNAAAPAAGPSPWGSLYASRGAGPPALEVALLRSAADGTLSAIDDGAVLHDGRGGTAPPDAVRVVFRPSEAMYVYVIAIDAAARVQPLYPLRFPPAGPVPGGAVVSLPDEDEAFALDEIRGVQHVYFTASRERQTDLEAQLYRFASEPQPAPGPARVGTPTRAEGDVVARGLVGAGEGALIDGSGVRITFPTTRAELPPGGGPIVVTRYFDHR